MSGHSKWSTIKRQKGITDQKRGLVFSKLAKAILLAARSGGADPEKNFKLRLAIEKAKQANMPKENIKRALLKASQKSGASQLREVVYEGYGPAGIALLIEAVTDNRNRTTAEIKNILERGGGSLAGPGSVAFQFKQWGLIKVAKKDNLDESLLKLIDLGVEDVQERSDSIWLLLPIEKLKKVAEAVQKAAFQVLTTEMIYQPVNPVSLEAAKEEKAVKLIEFLEEHEDVQKVYSNQALA